ncbi:MAG TPA: ATP-binding cassette domain-containing protein [Acidimicrobiia bacterium]|nr:ATP-binding cassette domain-containing protein [Acidimicrobiia bacterium]
MSFRLSPRRRRPERDAGTPLLECVGLEVAYGRTQILFDVSLDVEEGQVLAVLGTNGAGTSTLLRAITGLTPPKGGKVLLDGRDVTGTTPVKMAALGVTQMPGGRGIFPDLSVGENLRMATWTFRRDRARCRRATDRALDLFPALSSRLDDRAGLLSGGQQQMLALAQAFMPEPRLLLVDELSLGLAPVVVVELLEVVRRLRNEGVAVVLVEQSAELALQVADRAVFLEKGETRFSGPAREILERGDLVRSVFLSGARDQVQAAAQGKAAGGDRTFRTFDIASLVHAGKTRATLSARGLSKRFGGLTAVDGVDLDIEPGEIVGLIGPNGAGKTTILDVLSGFVVPDAGTVTLAAGNGNGKVDLTPLSPDARALRGLGRSFQDARLFPGLTVTETLAVSCERWVTSREPLAAALRLPASLLSEAEVRERVECILALLRLSVFRDRFASELSTGSRRLVEFGCLLAQEPEVLLLDEPSAGLARAEAEALGPVLKGIRDATGAALVVVEHDVALLRATCDRLIALDTGRIIASGTPAEVLDDPTVIRAYFGAATPITVP